MANFLNIPFLALCFIRSVIYFKNSYRYSSNGQLQTKSHNNHETLYLISYRTIRSENCRICEQSQILSMRYLSYDFS